MRIPYKSFSTRPLFITLYLQIQHTLRVKQGNYGNHAPDAHSQAEFASVIGPYQDRFEALIKANRTLPRKQRYTAKRIFEVIQAEGYAGAPSAGRSSCRWSGRWPGSLGIREFVRILGLHREHPAALVEQAVGHRATYALFSETMETKGVGRKQRA